MPDTDIFIRYRKLSKLGEMKFNNSKAASEILDSRGNQRDLAREKNQRKQLELAKKKASQDKHSGMTLEQRKQRDAEMMREKQRKALQQKDGTGS